MRVSETQSALSLARAERRTEQNRVWRSGRKWTRSEAELCCSGPGNEAVELWSYDRAQSVSRPGADSTTAAGQLAAPVVPGAREVGKRRSRSDMVVVESGTRGRE
jgi:hypothetical protein